MASTIDLNAIEKLLEKDDALLTDEERAQKETAMKFAFRVADKTDQSKLKEYQSERVDVAKRMREVEDKISSILDESDDVKEFLRLKKCAQEKLREANKLTKSSKDVEEYVKTDKEHRSLTTKRKKAANSPVEQHDHDQQEDEGEQGEDQEIAE